MALYGLFLFYGLTKEELAGRRPLAKFLSIKLIVMFTFYQSFVVSYPPPSRLLQFVTPRVTCSLAPWKAELSKVSTFVRILIHSRLTLAPKLPNTGLLPILQMALMRWPSVLR